MFINYNDKEINDNLLIFGLNRIKKLYPLHIICMLMMVILNVVMNKYSGIFRSILLHLTMTQTYFPIPSWYSTLNGPAWYLCPTLLSYILFPLILKFVKNVNNNIMSLIGLFGFQIIIAMVASTCLNIDKSENLCIQWLVYYFPCTRVIDFVIGCVLGKVYCNRTNKEENSNSMIECACFVTFFLISTFVYNGLENIALLEAIKYTVIFTPISCMIIFLLAEENGIISMLARTRIAMYFGNLSGYIFLIHMVCIKWLTYFFDGRLYYGYTSFFIIGLTFLLSMIWKQLNDRRTNEKRCG